MLGHSPWRRCVCPLPGQGAQGSVYPADKADGGRPPRCGSPSAVASPGTSSFRAASAGVSVLTRLATFSTCTSPPPARCFHRFGASGSHPTCYVTPPPCNFFTAVSIPPPSLYGSGMRVPRPPRYTSMPTYLSRNERCLGPLRRPASRVGTGRPITSSRSSTTCDYSEFTGPK